MLSRLRPRLTYGNVAATLALVLAMGGFAVAAVPGRDGKIKACYPSKTGALRVIDEKKKCAKGEKTLSWNQKGPAGAKGTNGINGATNVTVRTHTEMVTPTCTTFGPPPGTTICTATGTSRAACNPGERATGGGYPNDLGSPSENRPDPTDTVPTGWVVTVGKSTGTSTEPTAITAYAVCAAP